MVLYRKKYKLVLSGGPIRCIIHITEIKNHIVAKYALRLLLYMKQFISSVFGDQFDWQFFEFLRCLYKIFLDLLADLFAHNFSLPINGTIIFFVEQFFCNFTKVSYISYRYRLGTNTTALLKVLKSYNVEQAHS